jgi:hypothetical protein
MTGAAQIALLADCPPVPAARSDDEEIARGVVAFVTWLVSLVDHEEQRERAAAARRQRIAAKASQRSLDGRTGSSWWLPGDDRVHLPVLVPNSDHCGEDIDCERYTCPWHTSLELGEPEVVDGSVWRRATINTGWREEGDPVRGRRPSFNVEDQADERNWPPFEAALREERRAMREAGHDPCGDRFSKRVRAAREEAEDSVNPLAPQEIDDITVVAVGRMIGTSDESIRLTTNDAFAKLRNMARDGGYGETGDVDDLIEALAFGAGVE